MKKSTELQEELIKTYEDIRHFEGRVKRYHENLNAWWCESQRMQSKYGHKANVMDEMILFLKVRYVAILKGLENEINKTS